MRIKLTLLILIAIVLPAMSSGEVMYLKDGSTLKGKLVRVADSLFVFKTSFGAEFEIERDRIARIVFSDSIEVPMPILSASPPTVDAVAGSLLVVFAKIKMSSKINVTRGRDLEGHLAANAIRQTLLVQGAEVASWVDSTTDKEIRNGVDTQYKNDLELQRFLVPVQPGQIQCEIIIRNVGLVDYLDSFEGNPVDHSVVVSNVLIHPATTTVLKIGQKGKKFGFGKGSLVVQSD